MERFFIGLLSGWVLALGLVAVVPDSYHNLARSVKTECERSLPRDQRCRVIAVPESELTKNTESVTIKEY